jgi:hypothetical protein
VPITTPAYSPESNGLAEAFVKTFTRDYVGGAELRDAEFVLTPLGGWFADYNTQAPPRRRMARWDSGARWSTGRL